MRIDNDQIYVEDVPVTAIAFFLEMEQVHLAAEFAMVPFLGLFDLMQVRLEVLVAGPGGTINALQHGVVAVTPPVGTC